MPGSEFNAPDTSASADAKPFALIATSELWNPSDIADFVFTLPASDGRGRVAGLRRAVDVGGDLVHYVPEEDLAIITAGCESSSPMG